MPAYVWIALAVFALLIVIGLVVAGVQTYRAWRRGLPAAKRIRAASDELNARTSTLERRIAALEKKTAALQRDATRLSVSIARARVLLVAAQDAKSVVDRVRIFVPL